MNWLRENVCFQLHPNTVSAAYRELQNMGWVESFHGSGVYARAGQDQRGPVQLQALDRLVLDFLRGARLAGLTAGAAKARLDNLLAQRPQRFVFVHPDQELVACHEPRQVLAWEVLGEVSASLSDAVFLTLPSKYAEVRALVPPARDVVPIRVRSVASSLAWSNSADKNARFSA